VQMYVDTSWHNAAVLIHSGLLRPPSSRRSLLAFCAGTPSSARRARPLPASLLG
jgi:hypothetical protein